MKLHYRRGRYVQEMKLIAQAKHCSAKPEKVRAQLFKVSLA